MREGRMMGKYHRLDREAVVGEISAKKEYEIEIRWLTSDRESDTVGRERHPKRKCYGRDGQNREGGEGG